MTRREVVKDLTEKALYIITKNYGDKGIKPKYYHNDEHARDVANAAKRIASLAIKHGKLTRKQKDLLIIAAYFHDVVQDKGHGEDEELSAQLAVNEMIATGVFSSEECEVVRSCILATKVTLHKGLIKQDAPKNYLCQILADSDLANLGKSRSIYWDRVKKLYREQVSEVGIENFYNFHQTNLILLKKHKYYTEEAKKLFPHQLENLAFVSDKNHY